MPEMYNDSPMTAKEHEDFVRSCAPVLSAKDTPYDYFALRFSHSEKKELKKRFLELFRYPPSRAWAAMIVTDFFLTACRQAQREGMIFNEGFYPPEQARKTDVELPIGRADGGEVRASGVPVWLCHGFAWFTEVDPSMNFISWLACYEPDLLARFMCSRLQDSPLFFSPACTARLVVDVLALSRTVGYAQELRRKKGGTGELRVSPEQFSKNAAKMADLLAPLSDRLEMRFVASTKGALAEAHEIGRASVMAIVKARQPGAWRDPNALYALPD